MKMYFAFGFVMTVRHRLVVTFRTQIERRHAYMCKEILVRNQ